MSNPDIFFQTLAILEHPSDPMVIQFQLSFTEQFRARSLGLTEFKEATLRLFARHERLRFSLRCEVKAFRSVLEGADQALALNELAWSANALSLDEFRQLALPFDQAPLLRFRFDAAQGLSVACHHSLMDGHGCFELAAALLAELHSGQKGSESALVTGPAAAQGPVAALGPASGRGGAAAAPPFWLRVFRAIQEYRVMIGDQFRQMKEISRNPTSLVAPTQPPPSQRHIFLTRQIPLAELQAILFSLRQRGRVVTLNDLILAAFHLALQELISKRAEVGRLSLTVPFNMRAGTQGEPPFVNRTGYVSVSTLPKHRASRRLALLRINTEMARAKKYRTGRIVEVILGFYERTGLLKFARKAWLKNRKPARYEGPEKFFWKSFDTAVLTNLGSLRAQEPFKGWVASIHGFAPVISPAVSLAVAGYRDQLSLGLRFGSSVLSESDGAELLSGFERELRAFRE